MIQTITAWISTVITNLWRAFLNVVGSVLQFAADCVSAVLGWGLDAVLMFLVFVVGLLPDIPTGLTTTGPVPALIVQANYWVPLPTVFTCLAAVGATYAATYLYKLAKFARGAG